MSHHEYAPLGRLAPLKMALVPTFAGMLKYMGPGIVWAGLAQGSGELIWWPYLTAKYGEVFLGLLIPASLMQYWVNVEIARYTITTGETAMTGFSRISRGYAMLLWIGVFLENIWFGAYATAGGAALAELTGLPGGWTPRGQALFWAYTMIGVYLGALFVGRVIYVIIERLTMVVVVVTIAGMVFAVFQEPVLEAAGGFFTALLTPDFEKPANWDPEDLSTVLTAIVFAGAGGFGQLFLSYWMRDKGVGMALYMGRVTNPLRASAEVITSTGYVFADTEENRRAYTGFMRYLKIETIIGIALNFTTTLIMCWLAWALLRPEGIIPKGWELAVVQSAFFEVSWGAVGKSLFLLVAAAFLCDAWLQCTDGFSRMQADFVYSNFPRSHRYHFRSVYFFFVGVFTVLTTVTLPLAEPGQLIIIRGVIAFMAMALFCPGLIYLNYVLLPRVFPSWVKPHPLHRALMFLVTAIYVGGAIWYVVVRLGG
ncbi:MAG: Nramp family divalent metal transporter [candidate division Zixibacteria bacterium]|nr:Nramp family divalent metal transporter [candidate division Zixibacteria bacterium]